MLQIGTTELAKRLYEAWYEYKRRFHGAHPPLAWNRLDVDEQALWKAVAVAAGQAIGDAMQGASSPVRVD